MSKEKIFLSQIKCPEAPIMTLLTLCSAFGKDSLSLAVYLVTRPMGCTDEAFLTAAPESHSRANGSGYWFAILSSIFGLLILVFNLITFPKLSITWLIPPNMFCTLKTVLFLKTCCFW